MVLRMLRLKVGKHDLMLYLDKAVYPHGHDGSSSSPAELEKTKSKASWSMAAL